LLSGKHQSRRTTSRPAASSSGATPNTRRGRLGRNQYTRDRDALDVIDGVEPSSAHASGDEGEAGSSNGGHSEAGGVGTQVNGQSHGSNGTGLGIHSSSLAGGAVTGSSSILKPSKARVLNPQRTTMTEMKKRVASILNFISKTQVEMASEGKVTTPTKKKENKETEKVDQQPTISESANESSPDLAKGAAVEGEQEKKGEDVAAEGAIQPNKEKANITTASIEEKEPSKSETAEAEQTKESAAVTTSPTTTNDSLPSSTTSHSSESTLQAQTELQTPANAEVQPGIVGDDAHQAEHAKGTKQGAEDAVMVVVEEQKFTQLSSLEMMDALTRKLVLWQQEWGKYGEK
jgi:hypothetical protein